MKTSQACIRVLVSSLKQLWFTESGFVYLLLSWRLLGALLLHQAFSYVEAVRVQR